jgi:hypothetical membrane protein
VTGIVVRIAPFAGLIGGAVLAITSIVTAIAYEGRAGEGYSPFNHFVSELGEVGVSSLATVFNIGLMIAGPCFVLFMVGLALSRSGGIRYAYGILGGISGFAGFFVGIFPMNDGTIHGVVAGTFFGLAWIAIGLASLDFVLDREPRFPWWLAILGGVTVLVSVAFLLVLAGEGLGVPSPRPGFLAVTSLEWLVVISVIAWVLATSITWLRAGLGVRASEP